MQWPHGRYKQEHGPPLAGIERGAAAPWHVKKRKGKKKGSVAPWHVLRGAAAPGHVKIGCSGPMAGINRGMGAFSGTQWFMLPWVGPIKDLHITVKELAPIVVAAMVWGINWQGRTILARCDYVAVVGIVNSGSS